MTARDRASGGSGGPGPDRACDCTAAPETDRASGDGLAGPEPERTAGAPDGPGPERTAAAPDTRQPSGSPGPSAEPAPSRPPVRMCVRCGRTTAAPVLVCEVHGNSGPGWNVYACPDCAHRYPPAPDPLETLELLAAIRRRREQDG